MTKSSQRPLRVKACIPHFYSDNGNRTGYGSHRPGARLARSLALSHCLSHLIQLKRYRQDAVLNIGDRTIDLLDPEAASPSARPIELEILVCTDGKHELRDILDFYRPHINRLAINLDDPRQLPLAARDELITQSDDETDLYLYLEDDIIIHDPAYLEKQEWFLRRTNHQLILMPHRYENANVYGINHLLVDGPLDSKFISKFTSPKKHAASGLFRGIEKVSFDITSNPHSGTFVLDKEQAFQLRKETLPRAGFVGPLETAATMTVLKFFPVLKPSAECRSFLTVEHGHHSFRHYIKTLPHREQDSLAF